MSEEEKVVQCAQRGLWVFAVIFGAVAWVWKEPIATGCMAGCVALVVLGLYTRAIIATIASRQVKTHTITMSNNHTSAEEVAEVITQILKENK
jgi:hypothetical protein